MFDTLLNNFLIFHSSMIQTTLIYYTHCVCRHQTHHFPQIITRYCEEQRKNSCSIFIQSFQITTDESTYNKVLINCKRVNERWTKLRKEKLQEVFCLLYKQEYEKDDSGRGLKCTFSSGYVLLITSNSLTYTHIFYTNLLYSRKILLLFVAVIRNKINYISLNLVSHSVSL